jgi:GGDEF domain-containing protein
LSLTTSVGIAVYPSDGENGAVLLEKADLAMYRAKMLGQNSYEFYKEELSVDAW